MIGCDGESGRTSLPNFDRSMFASIWNGISCDYKNYDICRATWLGAGDGCDCYCYDEQGDPVWDPDCGERPADPASQTQESAGFTFEKMDIDFRYTNDHGLDEMECKPSDKPCEEVYPESIIRFIHTGYDGEITASFTAADGTVNQLRMCCQVRQDPSYRTSSGYSGGGGGGCFVAGTRIETPQGYLPVEELGLGDPVLSYDLDGDTLVNGSVSGIHLYRDREILEAEFDNGVRLWVTEEHPFYSLDQDDWLPIGELEVGTQVLTLGQGYLHIATLLEKRPVGTATVYNLTVESHSSYFAEGVLVHNKD
jgi:hypothetical protein